ncbi:MAG TPA: hypothetical protein VE978_07185 [Chitinophagales bacterium]|nr:hypothetical protein [Chitinophagales bacterium]
METKLLAVILCSSQPTLTQGVDWLQQPTEIISIFTPIILFVWFCYSQNQFFSKSYYDEITGIYAGYTEPTIEPSEGKGVHSGIIMNILDVNNKGYFIGQFDFAEIERSRNGNQINTRRLIDGTHRFLGKLNYKFYKNKSRHPFIAKKNRTYIGTLYIVDRFDFLFEKYEMETYTSAEYKIIHYREMRTMQFTLIKNYRKDNPKLPPSFTLSKSLGLTFEPYINVKEDIFQGDTRSDQKTS